MRGVLDGEVCVYGLYDDLVLVLLHDSCGYPCACEEYFDGVIDFDVVPPLAWFYVAYGYDDFVFEFDVGSDDGDVRGCFLCDDPVILFVGDDLSDVYAGFHFCCVM